MTNIATSVSSVSIFLELNKMLLREYIWKQLQELFYKKIVFRNFAIFKLKRDSSTVFFQWILQNFWEHLFWRESTNGCFYKIKLRKWIIAINVTTCLKKRLDFYQQFCFYHFCFQGFKFFFLSWAFSKPSLNSEIMETNTPPLDVF